MALLVIGLVSAGVGTMLFVRNALISNLDASLEQLATSDLVAPFFDVEVTDAGAEFALKGSAPATEYRVAVYSPLGDFITAAGGSGGNAPEFPAKITLDQTASRGLTPFEIPASEGGQVYHASVAIFEGPGAQLHTQLVALPLAPVDRTVATFFGVFAVLGLIVIVAGALATRLLVTQAFRQLGQVESAATAIAAGDFRQRLVPGDPRTEVGKLTVALNTMLDNVDHSISERDGSVRQMRRFIGDASHELRTPLVTVRGYAELYRMGAIQGEEATAQAMERIEKEAMRMGVMVEDLLALARLDERRDVVLTPVDLRAIAQDAALDVRASSPGRIISVTDQTAAPSAWADAGSDGTGGDAGAAHRRDGVGSVALGASTGAVTGRTGPRTAAERAADAKARREAAEARRRREAGQPGIAGALSLLRRIPRPVPASRAAEAAADAPAVTPLELRASTTGPVITRPPIVRGDENRIRQVVANLLGNARRFTPEDSPIDLAVGVDLDKVSESSPLGMGWISVADHGEGIPEQLRSHIFERFWRADTSRTRETGGTGLGLAIVASIVDALNGEIEVGDTPGGGATFKIWWPLAPESTLYLDTQPLPELVR